MKKHWVTILLVLVAVGLGAWLFLDRESVTESERRKRENNVFVAWRREELAKIVIAHEGETITLERDAKKDSSWRMKTPREERVDTAAVERLLTTFEFATVQRKVGESPATLGLETPRAHGEVKMGGMVLHFKLGAASPRPEGSGYLVVDDHAPVVVGKELVTALLAPSDTYRDRTVVPYLSLDLAKLELRHPAGGLTLVRHDDRAFEVGGRGILASRNGLERIWSALAEMRAETFPKDADADRLTSTPKLTMIMTPTDSAKPAGELVIGDACPGQPNDLVVLRKAPTRVAACAPKTVLDALLATPDALVDKRLFSVQFDEIEELRLERLGAASSSDAGDAGDGAPPRVIEVARKGTGFRMREPADRDLDAGEADAMTELIGRIADAQATSVEKAGGAFTAQARARVRFGDHEETIEIGAPDDKGSAVLRRVHDGALLTVGPEIVRRVLPRATSFRARTIFAETDRRVEKLILRCGLPQELVDKGSGFQMVEPKGYEASGKVRQIVDALTRGKIDTWIADEDDGSFGFTADGCRAVVAFADGRAPATISFGKEGESGVYAKVDTRNGVFVAPKPLHKWMTDILVSETSLRFEFDRMERVRVTYRGKPFTAIQQPLMKEAMGRIASTPIAFGRAAIAALPAPEIVIEVFLEGGAPKRIQCRPPEHPELRVAARKCTMDGSDVVFEVQPIGLQNLVPHEALVFDAGAPDAGADAATR